MGRVPAIFGNKEENRNTRQLTTMFILDHLRLELTTSGTKACHLSLS